MIDSLTLIRPLPMMLCSGVALSFLTGCPPEGWDLSEEINGTAEAAPTAERTFSIEVSDELLQEASQIVVETHFSVPSESERFIGEYRLTVGEGNDQESTNVALSEDATTTGDGYLFIEADLTKCGDPCEIPVKLEMNGSEGVDARVVWNLSASASGDPVAGQKDKNAPPQGASISIEAIETEDEMEQPR